MALEPPATCSKDGRDSEGKTLPFEGVNAHGAAASSSSRIARI